MSTNSEISLDYHYLNSYLDGVCFPRMLPVRQHFPRPCVENPEEKIREEFGRSGIASSIRPGMSVAVTCGSRGIVNIHRMMREICACIKSCGGEPFIVPAMGSHGGATAEGQRQIIEGYGVTQEYCGVPIRSSMEVVCIGQTEDGRDVFLDKNAYEADGIVVVGRVKPHTDFRGPYESGLMKMMVIGLGKQKGAETFHQEGPARMAANIPMFGKAVIRHANILFGIAILENAYEETALIEAVPANRIEEREPQLQQMAKELMPQSYIQDLDLLIIDRIGKDISGDGMDPNVTGRFCNPYVSGGMNARKMAVLGISPNSHGQMAGLGYGDVTTRRCIEQCDFTATFPNAFTSTTFSPFRIPMIMENDYYAIAACLKYNGGGDHDNPRVMRIRDTLHMDEILISEALAEEAEKHPNMEILGKSEEIAFDENGRLL